MKNITYYRILIQGFLGLTGCTMLMAGLSEYPNTPIEFWFLSTGLIILAFEGFGEYFYRFDDMLPVVQVNSKG